MGGLSQVITLGRYALHAEIASGGMATVYLGRLQGPVGFSKVVAIKRMHPHIAQDPDFAVMFLDEAALAARIQHPNVVATLDVVSQDRELFIVMEYIQGESLAALLREGKRKRLKAPLDISLGLMTGALAGLHAAHHARSDTGASLNIVHRDISPQNILVGLDGLARISDFGVAKAAVRAGVTRDSQVKGKLCYMSPEQMSGRSVDRRADVFAAAAVLWEMLAGRRLFRGDDAGALVAQILSSRAPSLREFRHDVPYAVDAAIQRALQPNPEERFSSAQAFADALEDAAPRLASPRTIGAWVAERAAQKLAAQDELISQMRSAPQPPATKEDPTAGASSQRSGVQPAPAAAPEADDDDFPTTARTKRDRRGGAPSVPRPESRPPRAEAPRAGAPAAEQRRSVSDPVAVGDDDVTIVLPPAEKRPAGQQATVPLPAAPPGRRRGDEAVSDAAVADGTSDPASPASPAAAAVEHPQRAESAAVPVAAPTSGATAETAEQPAAPLTAPWPQQPAEPVSGREPSAAAWPGTEAASPAAPPPSASGLSSVSSVMEDVPLTAQGMPSKARAVLIAAGGVAATILAIGAALAVLTSSPKGETAASPAATDEIAVDVKEEPPAESSYEPAETQGEPAAPELGSAATTTEPTSDATAEPSAARSAEPTARATATAAPTPPPAPRRPPKPSTTPKTYVPDLP